MPLSGAGADRLVLIGNVPVDLTVRVSRLPLPGEDLLASAAMATPGGGFHVLSAAHRAGMAVAYAGTHGSGPLGEMVRGELAALGCAVLQPALPTSDSGWVMVIVDGAGERTFITAPDVIRPYTTEILDSLSLCTSDLLCVSGYSLGLGDASTELSTWVGALSPDRRVMCDLGPYGSAAPAAILGPVLRRVDWLACNETEAARLTGGMGPLEAARMLSRRTVAGSRRGVLIRVGPGGCWLATADSAPVLVQAPVAETVVDTNGAGDIHTGAFLAALARDLAPYDAVVAANAAAAERVSGYGRTHGEGL